MTTLANIATNILTVLEREVGSQEWWDSAEISGLFNNLYADICREGNFNKTRDVTADSVAGTAEYALPSNTIEVLGMTYDGKPIYPTTIIELNASDENWRSRGNGVSKWYYFESGEQYTYRRLFPIPDTTGTEIGFEVAKLITALASTEEPIEPFADGLIIGDGVISIALAKEGEGQNIERSEYFWQLFAQKMATVIKRPTAQSRHHVLRSIEDTGLRQGLNLGDHYEPYRF